MSNYYYNNIMIELYRQAEIVEKRGEHDLAALLRSIVLEDKRESDRLQAIKVAAVNLAFEDIDR